MTQAKQLTDRFWHLFESKQFDALEALLDPDCHFKMPPNLDVRGVQGLMQMLRGYSVAFPDMHHDVKSYVESGDTIAIEIVITGTHTGPMMTPQGTIAATGKKVVWESCDYIRLKNGKLLTWHVYQDPTPFLTAMGLLPGGNA